MIKVYVTGKARLKTEISDKEIYCIQASFCGDVRDGDNTEGYVGIPIDRKTYEKLKGLVISDGLAKNKRLVVNGTLEVSVGDI